MRKKEYRRTYTPPPYNIGIPGGINGPFWSLANEQGSVVAMQITSHENAMLFRAAPEIHKALKSAGKYYEMLENATGVEHPVLEEIRAALALVKEK